VNRYRIYALCLLSFACLTAVAGCGTVRSQAPSSNAAFVGFPSEDALLDEFVAAIAANDKGAMDRLRVNATEYRDVIIPGTAPVGRTMQGTLSDKKFNFFWSMLDRKSRDYADVILHEFGGRHWRRVRHWYAGEAKEYSGYRAWDQVRIAVVDDEGRPATIRSGAIADVRGTY
jgi:hypothetical protein